MVAFTWVISISTKANTQPFSLVGIHDYGEHGACSVSFNSQSLVECSLQAWGREWEHTCWSHDILSSHTECSCFTLAHQTQWLQQGWIISFRNVPILVGRQWISGYQWAVFLSFHRHEMLTNWSLYYCSLWRFRWFEGVGQEAWSFGDSLHVKENSQQRRATEGL